MIKVPQSGRSTPEQSRHSYGSRKAQLIVAVSVAASLSLAIGIIWFVKVGSNAGTETAAVSTVRPIEIIRHAPVPDKSAKSTPAVPQNVQPPEGTIRRMEAISGTFKK